MVYAASGYEGLKIFDVSNPAAPTIVGWYATPGSAEGVHVVGQVVYLTDDHAGLVVLNATTPSAPTLLGNYSTDGGASEVHVIGNTAYVGVWAVGLVILNVTTPSSITWLGSYNYSSFTRLVPSGSLVHVVSGLTFFTLDVSNLSTPVLKPESWGHLDTRHSGRTRPSFVDMYVVGTTAYVADNEGLFVMNVTTPAHPTLLGEYDLPGITRRMLVVGGAAYVCVSSNMGGVNLVVVDVSTPTAPVMLSTHPTPLFYRAGDMLFAQGNFLYVASPALQVYDITAPLSPVLLGSYTSPGMVYTHAQDVFAAGSLVYLLDGDGMLQIYNTTTPSDPIYMGGCAAGAPAAGLFVDSARNIAYVAARGLVLIDVANPAAPVVLSTMSGGCEFIPYTDRCVADVFAVDMVAYIVVATDSDYFRAVDVSNPASPVLLGSCGGQRREWDPIRLALDNHGRGSDVRGIYVVDSIAYVAHFKRHIYWSDGLMIVNVTTPSSPSVVYDGVWSSSILKVFVAGTTAYVATGGIEGGLGIYDVSEPVSPRLIGNYSHVRYAIDVTVSGTTAYLASRGDGLLVLDVSNASSVVLLGRYASPSQYINAVAVSGNTVFMADVGLKIFDGTPPTPQPVPLPTLISTPVPAVPSDSTAVPAFFLLLLLLLLLFLSVFYRHCQRLFYAPHTAAPAAMSRAHP
eukprot:TRINITY_DN2097_c0_g4_i1.p1 TRINITY_DN2097_c0_g4~~TRINITY_DN2097_c0_g4_i1.p1  ORF type:complete len:734 (+),score=51.00 TRINITY_DN2097_c0_g4_i1:154-2202(+)